MIFVEAIFAYFAATKRGWSWYVAFPLVADIVCFLAMILASEARLVWVVVYLLSLLTLGLMLAFPKEKVLPFNPDDQHCY